jgi:uncharacterized membrane protein YgdD (TMEM256/DUF423 family)
MKCFVHPAADAVGICRNCARGVCVECAADRPSGVACKNRCEQAVDAMDALVRRNVAVAGKPSAMHWAQVVIYLGIALLTGSIAVSAAMNGSAETVILMGILAAFTGIGGLMVLRWILVNVRPRDATN